MTLLLWILGAALVIAGFAGIVLPALPGAVLIFLGLALAAWGDHFMHVSGWTLAVIGAIGAASYAVDLVAAAVGVKTLGASRRAMAGAALGTIAGLFLGLPGLIAGPFVGAVIGELTVNHDLSRASRVGAAAWVGFAIGMAVKVGLAFLMIGIFLAAWIF